jgi:hypothetical protein
MFTEVLKVDLPWPGSFDKYKAKIQEELAAAPTALGAQSIFVDLSVKGTAGRGFRAYWRWTSRRRGGRPRINREIRDLIRRMNKENPLWGAPRIHGELLMLGIEVAQSTVARYITKRHGPPSQGGKTFLRNHTAGIASIDLFVVRTSPSSCSTAW